MTFLLINIQYAFICSDLIDELKSYENRKTNIENQLAAAQDKLTKISKTLSEKTEQKDKHEMDLQGIKSQLADLNAVEYPDGNEMEVLVSKCKLKTGVFGIKFVDLSVR